jgi:Glycosyl hydrolase family 12/Cellulose binding domain
MRWRMALAGAVGTLLVAGGLVTTKTANADTSVCAKYGQARTASGYVAQNNLWGADTSQCITVSGDGFTLTTSQANKPTDGPPASYPSIFWGCHYGTCTSGFSPVPVSSAAFSSIATSARYGYVDQGAYDAAYDVWFDPTPRTDGQNTGAELMIWLNHRGGVQPVGSKVGTVRLAGADWDVWYGNIGWNVVSYVRSTPSTSISTSVSAFYNDVVGRGYGQTSWYLTSVQAGFEPWVGGEGLALTSFAVTTDGATAPAPTTPATTTTTTPPTTTTSPPTTTTTPPTSTPWPSTTTTGSTACTITTHRDEWPGGFVRYVTLTNSGSAALQGWRLSIDVGDDPQLTSGWNATWHQDGRLVTATNLDWNAALAPGASAAMGFQGTLSGADLEPSQWSVNGVACTIG